jgi:hypothetical protein
MSVRTASNILLDSSVLAMVLAKCSVVLSSFRRVRFHIDLIGPEIFVYEVSTQWILKIFVHFGVNKVFKITPSLRQFEIFFISICHFLFFMQMLLFPTKIKDLRVKPGRLKLITNDHLRDIFIAGA